MAYQLVFRSLSGEQTITLDRPIVVGRDPGCDVPIESVRVSRRHAEFAPSPDGVTVRDLGSRNGIFVNGVRVEQTTLGPTDRVLLGDVKVTLGATSAATSTQPPPSPYGAPAPNSYATPAPLSFSPPAPVAHPEPAPPVGYASPPSYPPPQWPSSPSGAGAGDKTSVLPRSAALATSPPAGRPSALAPPQSGNPNGLAGKLGRRAGLPARMTLAVLVTAAAAFLATAIPLAITHGQIVTRESVNRASTIARALGTENGAALAAGQTLAVSVQSALMEPGVKEAYILAPDGRVIAPTEKLDQSFSRLDALGDLATLQGLQTSSTKREVQAAVVIETAGRRLGVVWVRLDPSFTSAGSPLALYLAASLLTSLAFAFGMGLALRKMVMSRLATFATDVDLAASGQLEVVGESLGLPRLAESVNFVIGRMRTAAQAPVAQAPAPMYGAPIPGAGAPESAVPLGDGKLVLDGAYIIKDANQAAAQLLHTTVDRLMGHHVLEAVSDQALVTAIIDIMGDLGGGGAKRQQVPGSATQPPLQLDAQRIAADGPIDITIRRMG